MRDAAVRSLLSMYAAGPRCLARSRGSSSISIIRSSAFKIPSAPACRRLLTTAPHRNRQRYPSASPSTSYLCPRHYSTDVDTNAPPAPRIPNNAPKSVAVLGGGLTGLTTAWYLTRFLPEAKITIYEASDRLAGWIDNETVAVKTAGGEEGTVSFQRGARVLQGMHAAKSMPRFDDLVFYEMVAKLGLADELRYTTQDERPDRFIYYPDHLVRLPSAPGKGLAEKLPWLFSLLKQISQEPLYSGLFGSAARYVFSQLNPHYLPVSARDILTGSRDISVGHYFESRYGRPELVDNVLSAMMHGIYGGDVYKLSMASSPFAHRLPDVMGMELPMTVTGIRSEERDLMLTILRDKDTFNLATDCLEAGMLWFPDGLTSLTDRLIEELKKNANVTIKVGEPVTAVRYHEPTDSIAITSPSQQRPISYQKVISTIFAKTLANICDRHLPSLETSTATTIQVVNLWYPVPGLNHPYRGFGYLLPRSLEYTENPECVLGVLFDSDREFLPNPAEPGTFINRGSDTVHGTKLTVMMGGHYWDGLPESFLPDAETAVQQAKRAVARHMNWPNEWADHAVASTKLCRECIPQHTVGHISRMTKARSELEWAFHGKLAVVGGSYQPPGVMGSLRGARDIAQEASGTRPKTLFTVPTYGVGDSGLDRFGDVRLAAIEKRLIPLRFNSGAYLDEEGRLMPKEGPEGLKMINLERQGWDKRR